MSKTSQAHIRTNKVAAPPMPNRLVRLLSEARWLALGNRAEAQALTRQLWNSGYRDAQLLAALPHAGAAYPPNAAFRKQLAAASAGTAAASR